MKPICVKCQRFYRPLKNGTYFLEGMPTGDKSIPGTTHPEDWKPYKLWSGDKWFCDGCASEIIVGVGMHPVSEHYLPNFEETVERLGAKFQVNDC